MITIKKQQELNIMKEGSKKLAQIMDTLSQQVKPGVSANELNKAAEGLVLECGAEPAFKGYGGFPSALCIAINAETIVHGVPTDYVLQEGDIVSLDLGIKYRGFYSDMAVTLPVGEIDPEILRFLKATKKALKIGVKKARAGNTVGDIGNTIQRFVEYQGFNVVRDLFGHGIGRSLHEDPRVPNFGKRHKGEELKEGMVICIEPMTTIGDWRLIKTGDGFGFTTKDGSLSCHFEHTVAITKKGGKILTQL
ncbi:MAG: type I methionyl aminopeptidase [Parcubacteria group bacterium]|nr:type I methionyl aminopeptidase [Parcubacteria group bacterium]